MWYILQNDSLCHHGIMGQRWGIRRFQKRNGELTTMGRMRQKRNERRKAEQKRKRRQRLEDAKPAIIAVTAGTAIVGATVVAARYGEDIGRAIKRISGTAASAVEQSAVNLGKGAAKGMLNAPRKAFKYVTENAVVGHSGLSGGISGMWYISDNDALCHHGVKGQKWGVRRYQNRDGTLTAEGRKHWGIGDGKESTKSDGHSKTKSSGRNEKLKTALKVGAAVTAATAVGVIASRSYHKEAAMLDGFLKEYGNIIMSEQRKLSDSLIDLEKRSRKEDLDFGEASKRAERLYQDNAKSVSDARSKLRSSAEGTRRFTDKSLDTLATKRYFNDKLKASDYLSVCAEQGKQAVEKFLKAA